MNDSIKSNQLKAIGVLGLFVLAFWGLFIAHVALNALPYASIRLPLNHVVNTSNLMPEGWGFFTRSPREDRLLLYQRQNSSWTSAALPPLGQPHFAMGWDRAPRTQGVELAILLTAPKTQLTWSSCQVEPRHCLERVKRSRIRLKNRSPMPTLCGEVGVVKQPPIPWAWRNATQPVVMPSQVTRLGIEC
ncbi:MAG: SdpA family antimicrobial peptide system protein [Pleurocapsa sp. SU_196_0]|nr:SdpA family antimicrobial peptide system protein [Pleurocapsa sp. SU_196_0]